MDKQKDNVTDATTPTTAGAVADATKAASATKAQQPPRSETLGEQGVTPSRSEPFKEQRKTARAIYILEGGAVLLLVTLVTIVGALHFTRPPIAYQAQTASQEQTVEARVLDVIHTDTHTDDNGLIIVNQKLTLEILSQGPYQERKITLDYQGMGPTARAITFHEGQHALVMAFADPENPDGEPYFAVADHVRLGPLAALLALLVILTIGMGRGQGLRALIGLTLSGLLIGGFMIPQILAHRDPVLTSLTGTALLLAITLYLIQGWNTIAHTSLIAVLVSLGFTGLLAILWTQITHLTGFGSEETLYLQAVGVSVEMRGLLLAGMIVGMAGVLDDIILAQAVTTFELFNADRTLSRRDLYRRGMKIGLTHLASMINTLILAYASTALPLMILFYLYPEPWYLTINRELIAEEIVRALVGSLGVMAAVPLTTTIAAWVAPLLKQHQENNE
jgi:uncharacterized membrane protein